MTHRKRGQNFHLHFKNGTSGNYWSVGVSGFWKQLILVVPTNCAIISQSYFRFTLTSHVFNRQHLADDQE